MLYYHIIQTKEQLHIISQFVVTATQITELCNVSLLHWYLKDYPIECDTGIKIKAYLWL